MYMHHPFKLFALVSVWRKSRAEVCFLTSQPSIEWWALPMETRPTQTLPSERRCWQRASAGGRVGGEMLM